MTRSNGLPGRNAAIVLAMSGAVAACLGLPARLDASPAAALVCIVRPGVPIPGLEAGSLDGALALEQRKRGIVVVRAEAAHPESCPPAAAGQPRILVILGPEGDAILVGPSSGSQSLAIESLEPMDRARELARQAIGLIPESRDRGPTPMLVGPLPRLPQGEVDAPRRAVAPRGYAQAGGRYEFRSGNGAHAGGLDAEMGLSILDGRFEVGARAGWIKAGAVNGTAGPVSMQAVPAEIVARGGPRVGRVLLRLGVAAGLEWRRVEAPSPPLRTRAIHRTDVVASVGGEVEVAVDLVPGLRLAVAGTVRGFPGGTRYTWQDAVVYDAPRFAAGAALRLVAVFPGGPR